MSMISFLKVIAALQKSSILKPYRQHEGLIQECGFEEEFVFEMSFGLHMGWAIEGVIGSLFKIDGSYLSPNI